jgi:hypothetical protein
MFEGLRDFLLRWLRVPPEPQPPFGKPASLRVFRASRRFYQLRLVRWGIAQALALGGILFWLLVLTVSEHEAARVRAQNPEAGRLRNLPAGRNRLYLRPLRNVPPSMFHWLWVLKGIGVVAYLVQLGFTYAALRLDYELRWYIVTDRSLRIRSGLWTVQETTMSFANLQQVAITQGPLERLLRISNVRVESAGGGGKTAASGEGDDSGLHSGVFQGVENAEQIRDLILDRLRSFRESGLGDPDEKQHRPPFLTSAPSDSTVPKQDLLAAARELLSETRELRRNLTR